MAGNENNGKAKTQTNDEVSQQDSGNWQAQAEFWKLKYFEYMMHTSQVITMLGAPMLQQVRVARAAAAEQAAQSQ